MVGTVLDILSWSLLLGGGLVCVSSGVGLLRMPDFFTRSHAAGLTDTLGACMILLGLLLQVFAEHYHWSVAVRLVLIAVFLLMTGPTASHALAQAALGDGLKPLLGTLDEHGKSVDDTSKSPTSQVAP